MQIRECKRSSHPEYTQVFRYQRWLLTLTIALLTLLGAAFYEVPHVHAGSTGPIIHWDGTMIYPGQNNGYPEGPVGEIAVVHGENFTAGQQLKLVVVPGDVNTTPALCQPPSPGVSALVVPSVTVAATGTFSADFSWPAGVGQTGRQRENSICALNATDNTVVNSRDDGPFTVLSDNKPTINISAPNVAAGATLTVSGQNWVPPQPLNIAIAGCADCDPGNSSVASATTSSAGLNSGTFSVTIPIPATTTPGNYVVNVFSQNGPLDAFHLPGVGVRHLTVTAAVATPTPTATALPSPSATATVAATPTSNANTSGSNASDSGNNGLLTIVLIAIAIVVLAIGALLLFMLAQRKKSGPNAPADLPGSSLTSVPGNGQFNQYNAPGNRITPFPPGQPGNAPNEAFPGYNQSQQPGGFAPTSRACVRCGSPLAPNSTICSRCGMNNAAMSDPNGPTIAY